MSNITCPECNNPVNSEDEACAKPECEVKVAFGVLPNLLEANRKYSQPALVQEKQHAI